MIYTYILEHCGRFGWACISTSTPRSLTGMYPETGVERLPNDNIINLIEKSSNKGLNAQIRDTYLGHYSGIFWQICNKFCTEH